MSVFFSLRSMIRLALFYSACFSITVYANIQDDSEVDLNQKRTLKDSKTTTFEEFKNLKQQSYKERREKDILRRRSYLQNQIYPNNFGVSRRGKAVFVSADFLSANSGSIVNLLRGTKLSPFKKQNGSTSGYLIKSTKRGSFISVLGFEAGDIIYKINNQKIVSMSSIYRSYRRILKKRPLKVVVTYGSNKIPNKKRILTFFKTDTKVETSIKGE